MSKITKIVRDKVFYDRCFPHRNCKAVQKLNRVGRVELSQFDIFSLTCTERVVSLKIECGFVKYLTKFSWKILKHVIIVDPANYEGHITGELLLFMCSLDKLQSLNVSWCSQLTDISLIEVAKQCKKLRKLNVSLCTGLTDDSLQDIIHPLQS